MMKTKNGLLESMTAEELASTGYLQTITPAQVTSAYSGRPGCACGCNGTYWYAKAYQARSSKNRGYAVLDEEVNDRMVMTIYNKIVKAMSTNAPGIFGAVEGVFVAWEASDKRTYTIYVR